MRRLLRVTRILAASVLTPVALAGAQGNQQPAAGASETKGEFWHLADRTYYEPLLAEQRAARSFLVFPGWSQEFPHSEEAGTRFAWQITLGREFPMLGWQSDATGIGKGQWGVGLWIPIAFHMIEDFKDESAPIVDTDYRFGTMVKFEYGLTDADRLQIRYVPWAHESTHLGDEYTIIASRDPDFERINVSYEYQEYGASWVHAFGSRSTVTLRHGGIILHGSDGYYSDHLLGSDEPTLTPSEKNYEPSFGVEYRFPVRAPSAGKRSPTRQFIASLDLRNRLQYDFHRAGNETEHRRLTWTLAIGRAAFEGDRTLLRSYSFYFTRGVNPFGQLREQYPYWAGGIGWVFQ
jgi:hypothetical protein